VYGELSVQSTKIEETGMDAQPASDLKHVVIRQAPEGSYAMYGGLTRVSESEIVCFFKVGSRDPETGSPWTVRDETIVWTRSSDNGETWAAEENLIYRDGATRQEIGCGNGHCAGDGRLLQAFYILNPDYEERAKANNWANTHLAVSRNKGKTWETPKLDLPLVCAGSFGGFLKLRDGGVVLNVYGCAERGSFRHESGFIVSEDDCKTWSDYKLIGVGADPDGGAAKLNETDIVEVPDGAWLSMSRTQYSGFPLYRGLSSDRGRTWTVGPSGLTGLCPALLYTEAGPPGGTVVLAYHDRWGEHAAKGGMHLTFSHDGGRTWGEPVWFSAGAYPCLLALGGDRVLCSYYQSSDLLRGTIFRVPFPTGLRACTGLPGSEACGVRIEWDAYAGKAADDCTYRVYRSDQPSVFERDEDCVGAVTGAAGYGDSAVEPGRMYFYRVGAWEGDRRLGASWSASARAGVRK